jgi:hypothetical protein
MTAHIRGFFIGVVSRATDPSQDSYYLSATLEFDSLYGHYLRDIAPPSDLYRAIRASASSVA